MDAALNVLRQSPVSILDGLHPVALNPSTLAILDPARATALTGVQIPAAFGHGTMVAGVVHLVAPNARIMPLKAFTPNGTSRVFDIVRAIYYAVGHGARVINMSFSTASWSPEITHAINVAADRGVICVASAGNLGKELMVYPAAHRNVLAVGSTNAATPPVRSVFSNFGDSLVSLAAPGEGIITSYPGGGYAGAWGTSFSAPMVAGAAALLVQLDPAVDHAEAAALLGKAQAMASSGLGKGRLDLANSVRRANDATKPNVTFTTPASGAVSQTVSISATATDNVGVASVSFKVDDQPIGGEITSPPYQVSWNTTTASNGSHTLTAVARDAAGNTATATLSVTVSNDITPPAVAVTGPGQGTVLDAVTISASASDDSSVAGVQLRVDGVPLGAEDTDAPYELTWNSTSVSNGAHVITATARDASGHTTTSAPVTVVVANDSAAPVVALASPGETVTGSVTLTATATDDVAVAGVLFALDGVPVGAEDTSAPFSVAVDTTAVANGPHVLTATARDAAGRTTTSAEVTLGVGNDVTGPTVSITNAAGTVSGAVAIAAAASDDHAVAGVQFAVNGAPVGVEDTEAPYEVTWDTATATNGVHVLTAIARDAAGNRTIAQAVDVTVSNDAEAPVVALTTAAGSVSGSVTIAAAASDDIGVAGVQFMVDGVALGPEHTSAPYELAWDTAAATNGTHVLTAVARDAAGRTTTAEALEVSVLNDHAAPTVALLTESGTVSGSVTISAAATDDVGVVGVQFFLNGEPLGAEDTAPGYDVTWDTTTASNGTHVVTAIARDASGRTTASEPLTVTISNN